MTRKLDVINFACPLYLSLICLLHLARSAPVITGPGQVVEGNPVSLTCTVDGEYSENYTWFKDGEQLSTKGQVLEIASAEHTAHTGDYQCAVAGPNVSAVFKLTVQYFDGRLSICEATIDGKSASLKMPVYEAEVESSVMFKCCHGSAEPVPKVWWVNSDQEEVSNSSTLTLHSVTKANGGGNYECRAENVAGKESHQIFLFAPIGGGVAVDHHQSVAVTTPQPTVCVKLGETAKLPCQVSGDVVKITWSLLGSLLEYSDERYSFRSNELVIYEVESDNIGSYSCSATGIKEDHDSETVLLKENCIESVTIAGDSQITVGVFNSLSLTCDALFDDSLQGELIYTWSLPDGSLYEGKTLSLSSVGYDLNGTFTCTAGSDFSNPKSAQITVIVAEPPSVTINPVHPIAKLNHTLNVTCTTDVPGVTFVWKKGLEEIDSYNRTTITTDPLNRLSSILSISRFTKHDKGEYSCEVRSPIYLPVNKTFTVSLSTEIYLLWDVGIPAGINHNPFTLVCPVAGGVGELNTTWYRNYTPITSGDRSSGVYSGTNNAEQAELYISSLNIIHEYDNYTCKTIDEDGKKFEKVFKVFVEIPAFFKDSDTGTETVTANIGDMVDLECLVMGKPMPNIMWVPIDGQEIEGRYKNFTNGSFRIYNINEKDGGKYVCSFKWKESRNTQRKVYTLEVQRRQVGGTNANTTDTSNTEATILGLEQNIFIAVVVAAVGAIFLLLALILCCCLLCRYCCCERQSESEAPRIALETTSFERKPSLRGSYRFKDNSGILGKNATSPTGLWTFQSDKNNNSNSVPATAASSVAVSPGPPIPSPVPTPIGPTTSMVTAPEFQLPNNITSFPRQALKLDNVMGEGEFGPVFKGVARNIIKGEEQSLVAVKVLISREGEESLWPSLMEFANQMKLSSPFIASILGICSDSEPYYVIYDYLDRGDLKRFLLVSRPDPHAHVPSLTQSELVHIVTQVANGMSYLYKQQIIHGDLATRNCLIGSDLSVKIADLGIGHDLYPADYHDNGTQLLPIRWMAPELFVDSNVGPQFSLASDVWSFGIFCWEVFAYARQPYDDLSDAKVLRLIPAGHVPNAPEEGCPPLLFSLMQDCWAANIGDRPIFTKITSAILSIDVD